MRRVRACVLYFGAKHTFYMAGGGACKSLGAVLFYKDENNLNRRKMRTKGY